MADIIVESNASSNQGRNVLKKLVWLTDQVGYDFFVNNTTARRVQWRKTTDGGSTWSAATTLFFDNASTILSIWFDRWTPGDGGSVVHVTRMEFAAGTAQYRAFDTDTDTVLSGKTDAGGTGVTGDAVDGWDEAQLDICKARGGNLYIRRHAKGTSIEHEFFRSTDGGATWTTRADPTETYVNDEVDGALLVPGNETDANDIYAIWFDRSAGELTIKHYDDSANSWSESSAVFTGLTEFNGNQMMGYSASVRHSDNHIMVAVQSNPFNTADDLKFVDITNATTWTVKTDVYTNEDDHGGNGVFVDQNNDDLYVAYVGHPGDTTTDTTFNYKKSTDGGTTWGSRTQINQGTGYFRSSGIWAGMMALTAGGRFMPVWWETSVDDDRINKVNSVEITGTALARNQAVMVG